MKEINSISKGINYNAISLGSLCGLNDYVLTLSPGYRYRERFLSDTNLCAPEQKYHFRCLSPEAKPAFFTVITLTRRYTSL